MCISNDCCLFLTCLIHKDVFELNAQVAMIMFLIIGPTQQQQQQPKKTFSFAYGLWIDEKRNTQFESRHV